MPLKHAGTVKNRRKDADYRALAIDARHDQHFRNNRGEERQDEVVPSIISIGRIRLHNRGPSVTGRQPDEDDQQHEGEDVTRPTKRCGPQTSTT